MIETCQAYKVGENTFASFQEAQIHALKQIFTGITNRDDAALVEVIIANKSQVLAVLSMSEPVKRGRKPRSDVGKKHLGKKAKRALKEIESMEPASPIESTVEGSGKYANK